VLPVLITTSKLNMKEKQKFNAGEPKSTEIGVWKKRKWGKKGLVTQKGEMNKETGDELEAKKGS